MTNKTLGTLLITSAALLVFTAIFEPSMDIDAADSLYGVSGIIWVVIGPWAGFRLRKESTEEKK